MLQLAIQLAWLRGARARTHGDMALAGHPLYTVAPSYHSGDSLADTHPPDKVFLAKASPAPHSPACAEAGP